MERVLIARSEYSSDTLYVVHAGRLLPAWSNKHCNDCQSFGYSPRGSQCRSGISQQIWSAVSSGATLCRRIRRDTAAGEVFGIYASCDLEEGLSRLPDLCVGKRLDVREVRFASR